LSKDPEPQIFNNPFGSGFGGFHRSNIEDLFNDFFGNGNNRQYQSTKEDINININLTFEESILGCEKEIKYNKDNKCNGCNGLGKTPGPSTCRNCNGRGRIIIQQGSFRLEQGCPACRGSGGKMDVCSICNGAGIQNQEISAKLKIPPILRRDQNIRVSGGGHFIAYDQFGQANYSDLYLNPTINNNENIDIIINDNGDLVSTINISLLEALEGCKKEVYTVKGNKNIEIKPLSKNKDSIIIPNCGAGGIRSHIIIINVNYPNNINSLIEVLKNG
jgi:molecular chaperone DnaJ